MNCCYKILLSILGLAMSSCAGIRLAQVRKIRETPGGVRKILVIATVGNKNASLRQQVEECFADDLCYLGYDARPAYADAEFAKSLALGEQAVLAKIGNDSVDAIMTIAILDWSLERKAMPEEFWCSPYNNYNRTFYCYERALESKISGNRYYDSHHVFFWEFNFYLEQDQRLVYCARTNARQFSKLMQVKEYCDLAISDMVWQHVIQIKQGF